MAVTGRKDKPAPGDVTAARGAVTLAEAADAFLSSPRAASPAPARAYAGVIDRLAAELGPAPETRTVGGWCRECGVVVEAGGYLPRVSALSEITRLSRTPRGWMFL